MFQDLVAGAKPFCVILEWATPNVRRATAEELLPMLRMHDDATRHFEAEFQETPALEEVLALLRKRSSLIISTPEQDWKTPPGNEEAATPTHLTLPLRISLEWVPEAHHDSTKIRCGWVLSRIEFALMRKNGL